MGACLAGLGALGIRVARIEHLRKGELAESVRKEEEISGEAESGQKKPERALEGDGEKGASTKAEQRGREKAGDGGERAGPGEGSGVAHVPKDGGPAARKSVKRPKEVLKNHGVPRLRLYTSAVTARRKK
jgi:hypothetical protein